LPQNPYIPDGKVEYDDDGNLFDMGIIDSVGLISCIVFIEEEFQLKIPDEDLLPTNFSSIKKIANYIRSKTKDHTTVLSDGH
jgi:D-alanine--poly(phosphoribitol) ligase subunit 2